MGSKELAAKIYNDIQNRNTTTSILHDARLLGKLLNSKEFDWVEKELNGYNYGIDQIPNYRTVDALESKTWKGHFDSSLQKMYSSYLKETKWIKWSLPQSVTELEDKLSTGINGLGAILKALGYSGSSVKKDIYQSIAINSHEIKKVLDQIQDKVHSQLTDIIAKPNIIVPSTAIFSIYIEKFPEIKNELESINDFLNTGNSHLLAARSCRPPLHILIRSLNINIPDSYIFSDRKKVENKGEKSKIKYYLEQQGKKHFKDETKLVFIDEIFREVYDMASKADKYTVNLYEANYCVDKLIKFLEQFYRYTDLQPLK